MFRTYDVRGIYGKEVTQENFFILCRALEKFSKTLVAGMDYRQNNDSLAKALFAGFTLEENFMGFAPTPAIAFNSQELGVSLTASHNPPEYNGLKPLIEKRSFYVEELALLKKEFEKQRGQIAQAVIPPAFGKKPDEDSGLLEHYLNSLPEFGGGVFDLCGGAVCAMAKVFPKTIFAEPDPLYVKHSAEPTPDALGVLVSETGKSNSLGFAFDGDGDRLAAVDSGKIVDSGVLAAFLAQNFLKKGSKIVVTLDMQEEVFVFLKDNGFHPSYSAIGDVFVLKKAEEEGAAFAAEKAGHYSMLKHMPYSDGIYFSALVSLSKPGELNDFSAQFKNVFLSDKVEGVKVDFEKLAELVERQKPSSVETIDGGKASFDDYSILIRPSNTQPFVRVSVEAKSREKALEGLNEGKRLVFECKL